MDGCRQRVVHKPRLLDKKELENDLHDGERLIRVRGKKETDKCLFFIIFYICWLPRIQIFMVNGSSRDLFKMHCA